MTLDVVSFDDGVLVDPERLVRVTHDLPDGSSAEVVALACVYVPVASADRRVIAIEIIFDPDVQSPRDLPTDPYRCPVERLERRLLPPKCLKKIAPAITERKEGSP